MSSRNRYPTDISDQTDLRATIKAYVLPGYVPAKPLFQRDGNAVTLGSCFAANVHEALVRAGIGSTHLFLAEVTNTPAFALMFINALRGKHIQGLLGSVSPEFFTEEKLSPMRARLSTASVFIFTVGIALQPFRSDLPYFQLSARRNLAAAKWRMLTVEEILNYMRSVVEGIRSLRPDIPVVLTLSPIPLENSVIHPSALGQDCVSKSLLRVAIESLLQEGIPDLYYWPSFEIIRWLGGHIGPFFGTMGVDQRHIAAPILDIITELFIEHFFEAPAQPSAGG